MCQVFPLNTVRDGILPSSTTTTWNPAALNGVTNPVMRPVQFKPTVRSAVLWRGSADVMLAVAKTIELVPRLAVAGARHHAFQVAAAVSTAESLRRSFHSVVGFSWWSTQL